MRDGLDIETTLRMKDEEIASLRGQLKDMQLNFACEVKASVREHERANNAERQLEALREERNAAVRLLKRQYFEEYAETPITAAQDAPQSPTEEK
jgi:hypothetical protein